MIRTNRLFSRIVLLSALALAAGGCGRKGPLDAPPSASAAGTAAEVDQQGAQNSQNGNTLIGRSESGLPRVRGENKRIPLDALLN